MREWERQRELGHAGKGEDRPGRCRLDFPVPNLAHNWDMSIALQLAAVGPTSEGEQDRAVDNKMPAAAVAYWSEEYAVRKHWVKIILRMMGGASPRTATCGIALPTRLTRGFRSTSPPSRTRWCSRGTSQR